MEELIRTYTVPLRQQFIRAPRYRRTARAVKGLTNFVQRHMKAGELPVKITPEVNNEIWKDGIRNPPSKIKVDCKKDDKEVIVQLHGKPFPVKEEKKEESLTGKLMGKLGAKKPANVKPKAAKTEEAPAKEEAKTETAPKPAAPKPAPKPAAPKPAPAGKPKEAPKQMGH